MRAMVESGVSAGGAGTVAIDAAATVMESVFGSAMMDP
jgi:hypothetical protein